MILNAKMNKFGNVVGHGFFHDITFVVFYRMDTQTQFVSNHFTAKPFMAMSYNLQLS
jgi:hypothetical protein